MNIYLSFLVDLAWLMSMSLILYLVWRAIILTLTLNLFLSNIKLCVNILYLYRYFKRKGGKKTLVSALPDYICIIKQSIEHNHEQLIIYLL